VEVELESLGEGESDAIDDIVMRFSLVTYETSNFRERVALASSLVLQPTLSATLGTTLTDLLSAAKQQAESQKVYYQLLAN
jgi:hypothetical protein